jgi:hypothetical protein
MEHNDLTCDSLSVSSSDNAEATAVTACQFSFTRVPALPRENSR